MTYQKEDLGRRIDGCIRFWEAKLFYDIYLLEPSTVTLVQNTVKFLKSYRALVVGKQGELPIGKSSEKSSP